MGDLYPQNGSHMNTVTDSYGSNRWPGALGWEDPNIWHGSWPIHSSTRSSTVAASTPPSWSNSSIGAHHARRCHDELEHIPPLSDEVCALLAGAVVSLSTSLFTRATSSQSSPAPWCLPCCSGVCVRSWSDIGRSPSPLGGGLAVATKNGSREWS
jgi:hypothetical protein